MSTPLTDTFIRSLKTDKPHVILADGAMRCLYIRAYKTGKKVFCFRSKTGFKKLGEYPRMSLREARQQVREIQEGTSQFARRFNGELPTIRCPLGEEGGIYFLYQGERVVYVGISKRPLTRINTHRRDKGKTFDSYSVIHAPWEGIERVEAQYIQKLEPMYNKALRLDLVREASQ